MIHSQRTTTPPRVLSVGQCGLDGPQIERLLVEHFDADVATACDTRQALDAILSGHFDLVLVNRIFDGNGESGLDFIRQLRGDSDAKETPVMLVSNYADAQQAALELGAQPGFGKAALQAPQTTERLAAVLRCNQSKRPAESTQYER